MTTIGLAAGRFIAVARSGGPQNSPWKSAFVVRHSNSIFSGSPTITAYTTVDPCKRLWADQVFRARDRVSTSWPWLDGPCTVPTIPTVVQDCAGEGRAPSASSWDLRTLPLQSAPRVHAYHPPPRAPHSTTKGCGAVWPSLHSANSILWPGNHRGPARGWGGAAVNHDGTGSRRFCHGNATTGDDGDGGNTNTAAGFDSPLWLSLAAVVVLSFAMPIVSAARSWWASSDNDDSRQYRKWKAGALQGNAIAQEYLGYCHLNGVGTHPDAATAFEWYVTAAEQGLASAQHRVANCLRDGVGVRVDHKQALGWYREAAAQGQSASLNCVGLSYYTGTGVEQSYDEAFNWFHKGAEMGRSDAQYHLGVCYERGHGTPVDHSAAFDLFHKSASQGMPSAQNRLAVCHNRGCGTSVDGKAAFEWYQKAARQGLAAAQLNLGDCYRNGTGTAIDFATASKWYRKAADQGVPRAVARLADCDPSSFNPV
eukprot:m.188472 g.188472  ORF g.188472 m.188472 type:complete len:481 (+) comp24829_c0_seq1:87-1529(+)